MVEGSFLEINLGSHIERRKEEWHCGVPETSCLSLTLSGTENFMHLLYGSYRKLIEKL